MPEVAALGSVRQRARPHDDPVQSAFRDEPLLARLVPEVEREDDRDHEERVVQPEAPGGVPDTERRLAHEPRHVVSFHGPQQIARSLGQDPRGTQVAPMPERRQHGILALHGSVDGCVVQDVPRDDSKVRVLDGQILRVACECGDDKPALQRRRDERAARATGRSDDQDARRNAARRLSRGCGRRPACWAEARSTERDRQRHRVDKEDCEELHEVWCGEPSGLEVFWPQPRALCNPSKHTRTDLLTVMKCEHEVGPVDSGHRAMGAGLSLDRPTDPLERFKYPTSTGAWPVAHAARNAMFRRLGPSSPWSSRSATTRSARA